MVTTVPELENQSEHLLMEGPRPVHQKTPPKMHQFRTPHVISSEKYSAAASDRTNDCENKTVQPKLFGGGGPLRLRILHCDALHRSTIYLLTILENLLAALVSNPTDLRLD